LIDLRHDIRTPRLVKAVAAMTTANCETAINQPNADQCPANFETMPCAPAARTCWSIAVSLRRCLVKVAITRTVLVLHLNAVTCSGPPMSALGPILVDFAQSGSVSSISLGQFFLVRVKPNYTPPTRLNSTVASRRCRRCVLGLKRG